MTYDLSGWYFSVEQELMDSLSDIYTTRGLQWHAYYRNNSLHFDDTEINNANMVESIHSTIKELCTIKTHFQTHIMCICPQPKDYLVLITIHDAC